MRRLIHVGPAVPRRDDETDARAISVSPAVQDGLDATLEQLLVQVDCVEIGVELERLHRKQPIAYGKPNLHQALAEVTHVLREASSQLVAIVIIGAQRVLSGVDGYI